MRRIDDCLPVDNSSRKPILRLRDRLAQNGDGRRCYSLAPIMTAILAASWILSGSASAYASIPQLHSLSASTSAAAAPLTKGEASGLTRTWTAERKLVLAVRLLQTVKTSPYAVTVAVTHSASLRTLSNVQANAAVSDPGATDKKYGWLGTVVELTRARLAAWHSILAAPTFYLKR